MYKAILVDDDNFDLIGMQQLIPWSSLQIEIVYSTTKPLAALAYIQNNEIDILISDIKMPVMTGLELAKNALERNPELKVLFISGYQDFEYAKQALYMKADGYILKPVDDDEIIRTLQGIVQSLDERARVELPDIPMESIRFIKQNFVQQLMEGPVDAASLQAFMNQYPLELSSSSVVGVIVEIDRITGKKPESDAAPDRQAETARLVAEWIDSQGIGMWSKLSSSRIGMIYDGGSEEAARDLNALLGYVRANGGGMTVTVSYGQAVSDPALLTGSFKEARELMDCKMFIGKNRIIPPGALMTTAVRDAKDMNSILDQLFTAISNYALVAVCDCIEELFDIIRTFAEPVKVYHFSTHIVSRLEGYLSDSGTSSNVLAAWKEEGFAAVQQFETIDDIKSWLRRTAFELSELIYTRSQKPAWRLYTDIEEYVTTHLSEDITLKEVASRFSYSPNHFGVLFKEQVGVSFNDYVVNRRMNKAKEMLLNPHFKIYEIADQVGYKSLTYFSRMFKEAFGMTPGDYRKQG
ncbi:helix-turn-helix domain-containing protein [Paenibacillus kobensis]|uniref:helix-turn-helix domain-containing protein n=1 Tax=Paenibacillus kobensis TaxID=59841 RepID=UPI000FD8E8CD|nr:helix-turn-helix domain-containing protein [Paenibacillus kobensis]